jgi:hypothetical protein
MRACEHDRRSVLGYFMKESGLSSACSHKRGRVRLIIDRQPPPDWGARSCYCQGVVDSRDVTLVAPRRMLDLMLKNRIQRTWRPLFALGPHSGARH